LCRSGESVDDAGNPRSVVRATPLLARKRDTPGYRTVDFGELVSLFAAVIGGKPQESAPFPAKLLFEVERKAGTRGVIPHDREFGRTAGPLGSADGIGIIRHPPAV